MANGYSSFPSPYDAPLSPRAIVSLAGSFFASCPDGSAPTIQPFPAATLTSTNATLGSTLAVSVNETVIADQATLYCAFVSGVQNAFTKYENGSCDLPAQNVTGGQVYGIITNAMNIVSWSFLSVHVCSYLLDSLTLRPLLVLSLSTSIPATTPYRDQPRKVEATRPSLQLNA